MRRKFKDLPPIYGDETVRTIFEVICEHIVRHITPEDINVKPVAIKKGDGGIDVFVGDYGIEPITVYQCKFFINEIGKSQKDQVRESIKSVMNNPKISVKEWILCMPKEFNEEEHAWFSGRKKTWEKEFKVKISYKLENELLKYCDEANIYEKYFLKESERIGEQLSTQLSTFESNIKQENQLLMNSNKGDAVGALLNEEYHQEINEIRDLLNAYSPDTALLLLEKLKSRIWHNADNKAKFRITNNIGAAYLQMGKIPEACDSFVEANTYIADDEIGLNNLALSFIFNDEFDEAQKTAKQCIGKFPNSYRGYSSYIQSSKNIDELRSRIIEIPSLLKNNSHINYGIAHRLYNFEEYEEAILVMNRLVDKDQQPDFLADLGVFKIKYTLDKKLKGDFTKNLDENDRELLETAISNLNEAWEKIKDKEDAKYRLEWIHNKSIAERLIGKQKEAELGLKFITETDPENTEFLRNYYACMCEIGKTDSVLKELEKNDVVNKNEAFYMLYLVCCKSQKVDIKKVIELVEKCPFDGDHIFEESNTLLLDYFIDLEMFEEALNKSSELSNKNPFFNIYIAISKRLLNKPIEEVIVCLDEAVSHVVSNGHFLQKKQLADEYYKIGEYLKAAEILENVVNKNEISVLFKDLLNCYFKVGFYQKILKYIGGIAPELSEQDKFFTELLCMIYDDIGDSKKAREVCEIYLTHDPEDINIQLRKALVCLRLEDYEAIDDYIAKIIKTDLLEYPLDKLWGVVELLIIRNKYEFLMEFLYEMLRKYPDNHEVQLKYVALFHHLPKEFEFKDYKTVDIGCTFCVEYSGREIETYIYEDYNKAVSPIDWRLVSFDRIKPFINKEVGFQGKFDETHKYSESFKITALFDKYIFKYNDILNSFQRNFPNQKAIFKVNMSKDEETGELDISPILDQVDDYTDWVKNMMNHYKSKMVPICMLSNMLSKDILKTRALISYSEHTPLIVCFGTVQEREIIKQILTKAVVIDLISICSLFDLKIEEIVPNYLGNIYIAQATVDELNQIIFEHTNELNKTNLTLGKEGESYIKHEPEEEQKEKYINYIKKIKAWIDKYCKVAPAYHSIEISVEEKDKFTELLGRPSFHSIMIAVEYDLHLFSDDLRLRQISEHSFKTTGFWSQALLLKLLEVKAIQQDHYWQSVIDLILMDYHFTSIDANVLMYAIESSSWEFTSRVKKIFTNLSKDSCLREYRIGLSAVIIQMIFDREIDKPIKTTTIAEILKIAIEQEDVDNFIKTFKNHLVRIKKTGHYIKFISFELFKILSALGLV